MHKSSIKLMKYFIDKYVEEGSTVLDIGSKRHLQQKTYAPLFNKCDYFGLDVEQGNNVDIIGFKNIKHLYDIVVSGQTMEHVNRPWEWLKNLVKYYKKYICIIAPNSFNEHRFPIDTYRYFPDGMRDLFDYAGIIEVEIFKKGKDTIGIGTK